MAITIDTHTTYPGTTPYSLSVPLPTWSNWVPDDTEAQQKYTLFLRDYTSPTSSPRKLKLQNRPIQNIYNGLDIPAAARSEMKGGNLLFFEYSPIWDKNDSADATYNVKLPLVGSVQLRIPKDDLITEALINQFIGEMMEVIITTAGALRLGKFRAGSLNPNN